MIQSVKKLLSEQQQRIDELEAQLKKEKQEKVYLSTTVFDLRYKQREMEKIIQGKRSY
jgi:exonuclease VII large subunit